MTYIFKKEFKSVMYIYIFPVMNVIIMYYKYVLPKFLKHIPENSHEGKLRRKYTRKQRNDQSEGIEVSYLINFYITIKVSKYIKVLET